jgi:hypothetical protein
LPILARERPSLAATRIRPANRDFRMPFRNLRLASDGTHGQCCACGTSIPACEPIYEKFGRCYFCGRFNPIGPRLAVLLTPVCLILALAALTMWFGHVPH